MWLKIEMNRNENDPVCVSEFQIPEFNSEYENSPNRPTSFIFHNNLQRNLSNVLEQNGEEQKTSSPANNLNQAQTVFRIEQNRYRGSFRGCKVPPMSRMDQASNLVPVRPSQTLETLGVSKLAYSGVQNEVKCIFEILAFLESAKSV